MGYSTDTTPGPAGAPGANGADGAPGGVVQTYVGYNTAGGSQETMTDNRVYLKKVTFPSAGWLHSIDAYLDQGASDDRVQSVGAALLSDSAGTPNLVVASMVAPDVSLLLDKINGAGGNANPRWLCLPVSYYVATGTDYWLAVQLGDNNAGNAALRLYFDSGGTDQFYTAGGHWIADAGWYTATVTTSKYSIRGSFQTNGVATSATAANTVQSETDYGIASAAGTGTSYSREFHTHGSPAHELPAGGTNNQVLAKNTTSDYGVAWVAAAGGTPADTVVSETSFGQSAAAGTGTKYSREFHTHGTPAAPAATWPAYIFGDGTDGALTFDGTSTVLGFVPTSSTYKLTKDIYATTIVINSGVTIRPDGYRIFASTSINNSGTISANGDAGGDGTSGTGGPVPTGTDYTTANTEKSFGGITTCGSGIGAAGTAAGGNAAANSFPTGQGQGRFPTAASGAGGGGVDTTGASRAGGTAYSGSASTGLIRGRNIGDLWQNTPINSTNPVGSNMGFGGGGGAGLETNAGGGAGGGPGGAIWLAAPSILNTGTIRANGGKGGNAFATKAGCGGGGGAGGVIALVYNTNATTGTVQASAGAAGSSSNIVPNAAWSQQTVYNSATDAALYTSASLTPVAATSFLVLHVAVSSGTAPTLSSITGTNGWNVTWTLVTSTLYNGNLNRIIVVRGTPSSTTAGTITANLSGTAIGGQGLYLTNANLAAEASVVVQAPVATGASGNATITGAALGNLANVVLGIMADLSTAANVSAGTGYTELVEVNVAAGAGTLEAEATTVNTANSATAAWTNTSGAWGAILIETLNKAQYSAVPAAGGAGSIFNFTP